MDHLTSDKPIIAPGCKPTNGNLYGLDDFIKFISQDGSKIKSSVAAVTHPEVEATAKKIADEGQRFLGKLGDESPSKLTGEGLKDFQDCRMKGYEALHSVFRERMRAAVDSFKPFAEEGTPLVVKSGLKGDVPCFHLADTVAANPHFFKVKIKEAWLAHTAGGHRENLSTLAENNKAAETLLDISPCKPDDVLFPKRAKLGNAAKLAEEVSDAEFERLASKKGYKRIANKKWRGTTLPEVRTKLKYEKLTPESPNVNVGKGGFKAPLIGPLDVGQSQGVAPLGDNTLSIQDYLRNTFINMSEASIQLYTLHHTTQVTKLLLGELVQDQLSTKLPSSSDTQGARDLQTLIAIKFGRVTDESKMWLAKQQYPQGPWSLILTPEDERNARIIVNPDVPPKIPDLTGPTSLFLATGLSKAIIASLTDQERALSARGLPEGSQAMAEQAKKLGELVSNHKSLWSALVEAQKRKDTADAELLADPKAANATDDKAAKRSLPRSASACGAQFAAAML